MSSTPFRLTWLLRAIGLMDLMAFVPLIMPAQSLAVAHQWLGMGTFPETAVTEYLARTASLLYGLCGLLLLFLSTDVLRYRPVIRWIAGCGVIAGFILIGIDVAANMPLWWTSLEGPLCTFLWLLIWWASGGQTYHRE